MPRPVLLAAISACVLHAMPAIAESPPIAPVERYIADTFGAIVEASASAPNTIVAADRLKTVLADDFALPATARFVLGRYWPTDNPAAAGKFQSEFLDFMGDALAEGIRMYPQMHLKLGRVPTGSNGTIYVDSVLTLPGGPDLPLDWIVNSPDPDGRYHITDIVLLGIDARVMLRSIATSALSEGDRNLNRVVALFRRAAAQALSTAPPATTAGNPSTAIPAQP